MSQPIELAVCITMTVLQSMEKAVRRDILCHRVKRNTSGGIKLYYSQWRYLKERYNCITVLRASIRRDITVSQSIEMAVRIDLTVSQP